MRDSESLMVNVKVSGFGVRWGRGGGGGFLLEDNVEIRSPYLIFFLTNKRSFHCANCVVPVSAINRHFRALWEIVLIIRLPGSPLGIDHVTTIRPNLKCVVQTDPHSTMGFSDWTCNTQRLRLT